MICDPWQGVAHVQGPLWLAAGTEGWNVKLDSTLKEIGFGQSPHEAAIYQ
jgi:hypothetical protein